MDGQCFLSQKFSIAGDAREELVLAMDPFVAKQFILSGKSLRALFALEWFVIAVDCGKMAIQFPLSNELFVARVAAIVADVRMG